MAAVSIFVGAKMRKLYNWIHIVGAWDISVLLSHLELSLFFHWLDLFRIDGGTGNDDVAKTMFTKGIVETAQSEHLE